MEAKRINGRAYAQSCLSGHEADKALDGNTETYWEAEPYYQWWMLDCEGLYDIETITVETKSDGDKYYRYAIEYSADRINWQELYEKTDNEMPIPGGETYEAHVRARYIRITMTYCSEGEAVSLVRVEAVGCPIENVDSGRQDLTKARVRAVECDEACGFEQKETDELEPGWTDQMLLADQAGCYAVFKNVQLNRLEGQQLKGLFYLPEEDATLHIQAEIRLDGKDGKIIGQMDMHLQFTPWVQFACDLADGEYGNHDLYFCITGMDAPQKLGILWLQIMPKPELKRSIIDHADELPEGAVAGDRNELKEYKAYLGNVHCHTGFSDGAHTPNFAYDYARYVAKLDFLGITEHSNLFDDTFDANASRKWRDIKRFAEEKTENGKFLALMGSETTWYNQFGHMNMYGADYFLNPYELRYNDTKQYYERLKEYPRAINQWNHPWSCGDRHLDMFEPYDAELDPVMYTMELKSFEDLEMEGLSYYIHALDLGWHIAPVGNQDNHSADWGTYNDVRTGVVVKQLTKADFYDAYRNHRTYYTCAKNLRLAYQTNGYMMGSIIPKAEQYCFEVKLTNQETDAEFKSIEVLGEQGKVLMTVPVIGHSADISFDVTVQNRYYFLRIRQQDGALAITAPVWPE